MIRLIAAARTTILLIAWLAGVPTGLVTVTGSPIPSRMPSAAQLKVWMENPLDPTYQTASVRVVTWTVWALITTALLAALSVRARAARWDRLISFLPPPAQSLTAALLGTAAVASASTLVSSPAAVAVATANDVTGFDTDHTAQGDHSSLPPGSADAAPMAGHARTAAAPAAHHDNDSTTAPTTLTTPDNHPSESRADRRNAAGQAYDGAALPSREPQTRHRQHRVVRGDTLWDIAYHHLGDPHRWSEIYRLNHGHRQANGYALTDPDEIDIGWVLALPARHPRVHPTGPKAPPLPSPPASTAPATPSTSTAPPASSPTHSDAKAAPSSSTDPSTAPAASFTSAIPSASGLAPSMTPVDNGDQASTASPVNGVDLPGGWLTLGLGSGLLAAAAMVWRRRRHHYRPTPITSAQLTDADLVPPLAAMTRIRTRLRRAAPEIVEQHPASPPTVREYQAAAVKPELPPVGPTGSQLSGATALPLSTGLGLVGGGALAAARGLLIATLTSGSDDDPDARGRAITTAATVAAMGLSDADTEGLDRLTVSASDTDAITRLEEEIIRRSRLIADAQAADVDTLRHADACAEPLPQLLFIAGPPDPAWTNRLITAVTLGQSVDIGAVVIGDWPTGATLTVAADGTTGSPDAPRLTVLDTITAVDMLRMLREAHGRTSSPEHLELAVPPTAAGAPDVAADQDIEGVDDTPAATPAAPAGRLPVTVRVLGRPAVLDHHGQPSPGIRSKALELLVYLAVNRHGATLIDIMEALYPDANLRRASERLSTVVADLRKHIRRAANPTETHQTGRQRLEPIPNTGSRYHLDPAVVSVDWWTALDHYEATATASDDDQRLSHLTAAINAATGPLAEGADYDWIDTDREVVRRHRIKLHTHAAALLADTDQHRSWLLLEQACHIDPLCDDLARTTMRAAAALGDADAIRHRLTTLREALETHGLELSDETAALASDMLRHMPPPRPSEHGTRERIPP